jgi:hypothetical protein
VTGAGQGLVDADLVDIDLVDTDEGLAVLPPSPSVGRITVFAPSPVLTITIESGVARDEVHLHAGGQGFWVAQLAATLGASV